MGKLMYDWIEYRGRLAMKSLDFEDGYVADWYLDYWY